MRISTKGRYALRLMIDLAEQPSGAIISLKAISARQGISVKYLEMIVKMLNRAGYVKSYRGKAGGYSLVAAPETCTAGAIIMAVEGSLAPVACLASETDCQRKDICKALPFWQGLDEVIDDYVNKTTLADLSNMEQG